MPALNHDVLIFNYFLTATCERCTRPSEFTSSKYRPFCNSLRSIGLSWVPVARVVFHNTLPVKSKTRTCTGVVDGLLRRKVPEAPRGLGYTTTSGAVVKVMEGDQALLLAVLVLEGHTLRTRHS